MTDRDYGKPRDEGEIRALGRILHRSFVAGDELETTERWMNRAGHEHLRVMREDGEVVGGLLTVPMGLFLGGRSVSTVGIAGVGIDPAKRGRKIAQELMRHACGEFRETFPISSLYASTYGLYRSVGYERCGGRFRASINLRDLNFRERGLEVRTMVEADRDAVMKLYRECAQKQSGKLDRGPYIWDRIENPRDVKVLHSWVVLEEKRIVGYARWHQAPPGSGTDGCENIYDLVVVDLAALHARAIQRIFTLFADHSTVGGALRWYSGPDDAFLLALPDRFYSLELADLWMIRLLDVEAALKARGWLASVSGELHFSVRDEQLARNAGDYVLSVSGGEAHVERGGDGRVQCDVRALAALYSGYLTPPALESLGWLQGPADQLDLARALFTGPMPWCPDMY